MTLLHVKSKRAEVKVIESRIVVARMGCSGVGRSGKVLVTGCNLPAISSEDLMSRTATVINNTALYT